MRRWSHGSCKRGQSLPGDGIGPEVTAEAVAVLRAVAQRFDLELELEEAIDRRRAIDAVGIRAAGRRRCACAQASRRGAARRRRRSEVGRSAGRRVRPEQALLGIRKALGLFANLRPVRRVAGAARRRRPLKPEVRRRRRHPRRPRAHRRHLLRQAERATAAARTAARRSTPLVYTEDEVAPRGRASRSSSRASGARR